MKLLLLCASTLLSFSAYANFNAKAYKTHSPDCRIQQSFPQWLAQFKKEALQKGVQPQTLNIALHQLTPDHSIIQKDRSQSVFTQDFLTFSSRMVSPYRIKRGQQKIHQHKEIFAKIKQQYGIPAPVIAAFWALETDFGANTGHLPVIRSLATLAWDCRRPQLFRDQLLAALKIINRGDLSLAQMRGAWAGEIGQTQFLPSEYLSKGVDFDRDGKVDMINSTADALASTAKILQGMGWKRNQPWLIEVMTPPNLAWEKTGIDQQHTGRFWAQQGVKQRNGQALSHQHLRASLLLPMGRNGPAFIAYPNFYNVYFKWNSSTVYSTTVAYLATRLSGAPRLYAGKQTINKLTINEVKQLQQRLQTLGFDVGERDGIIGKKTRKAVKIMQQRMKLPADSYPDRHFHNQLQHYRNR